MELNEKELEKVLGGVNPNVVSKEQYRSDQLDENDLEHVLAGIYKKELADEIAKKNPHLYRQEMIDEISVENEENVKKR